MEYFFQKNTPNVIMYFIFNDGDVNDDVSDDFLIND